MGSLGKEGRKLFSRDTRNSHLFSLLNVGASGKRLGTFRKCG
jgi:hypothetical protein